MTKKDFFGNWIVKNLLLAVLFVIVVLVAVNIFLAIFTQHGKTIKVPDFTNLTVPEAQAVAERRGVRVEVTDSVFVRQMKRGAVFSQNPEPGAAVKQGRRVILTINAVAAKTVSMPELVGFSMRQAKAELASRGLVLGRLRYVDDIATNNVLRQLYRGRDIEADEKVEIGSKIDLVVGLNREEGMTYVPNLEGMRYLRAVDLIQESSLNVGRLVFDRAIRSYNDSLSAVVYQQRPSSIGTPIPMGSDITVYLRLETQE